MSLISYLTAFTFGLLVLLASIHSYGESIGHKPKRHGTYTDRVDLCPPSIPVSTERGTVMGELIHRNKVKIPLYGEVYVLLQGDGSLAKLVQDKGATANDTAHLALSKAQLGYSECSFMLNGTLFILHAAKRR